MPATSERRRSNRVALKQRASLIVERGRQAQRIPCLVLDSSKDGFKIAGPSRLKRGQAVELILGEDTPNTVLCRVMWVGSPRSKQEGEAGLRIQSWVVPD